MNIGIIKLMIFIPQSNSLKEKRRVISSYINKMKNKFNISILEIGEKNLWQKSEIGIAFVVENNKSFDIISQKIIDFTYSNKDFEVLDYYKELL